MPSLCRTRGVSLLEMLVAIATGAVLMALIGTGVSSMRSKARNIQCLSRMRTLGAGILLYSQDNNGELPRSHHSAAGCGKPPWGKAIFPYTGLSGDLSDPAWTHTFNTHYRCPSDKNTSLTLWSYGLNVYFELTPDGDDYAGSPETWRRLVNIEQPGATILLAELKPVHYADHIMCHLWTSERGAVNAIDSVRHGKQSNYLFVDGHVEPLAIAATFDPGRGINRWNPSLAK